jgi:hypothetical protein
MTGLAPNSSKPRSSILSSREALPLPIIDKKLGFPKHNCLSLALFLQSIISHRHNCLLWVQADSLGWERAAPPHPPRWSDYRNYKVSNLKKKMKTKIGKKKHYYLCMARH